MSTISDEQITPQREAISGETQADDKSPGYSLDNNYDDIPSWGVIAIRKNSEKHYFEVSQGCSCCQIVWQVPKNGAEIIYTEKHPFPFRWYAAKQFDEHLFALPPTNMRTLWFDKLRASADGEDGNRVFITCRDAPLQGPETEKAQKLRENFLKVQTALVQAQAEYIKADDAYLTAEDALNEEISSQFPPEDEVHRALPTSSSGIAVFDTLRAS